MCLPDLASMTNAVSTGMGYAAAKNNAAYQAGVYNNNAKIAEAQERSVGQQGAYEQNQLRDRAKQITGAQKAAFSANGLDISSGSPLAVLADTAYQSEQDIGMSRTNTQMEMWGLQNQANQYRAQASAAKRAGTFAAIGTLLNGITNAQKQYSVFGDNNSSGSNIYQGGSYNSGINLAPKDAGGNFFIGNNNYSFNNSLMPKTTAPKYLTYGW